MKYEAIELHSAEFNVKKMCQVLGVKAPNYYRWKRNKLKKSSKFFIELRDIKIIEKIFLESDKTYGYRAVKKQLDKERIPMSEYRVRRIMKENGFYPETNRKFRPTRNGKKNGMYYENILKQKFNANRENQVWVGDITPYVLA